MILVLIIGASGNIRFLTNIPEYIYLGIFSLLVIIWASILYIVLFSKYKLDSLGKFTFGTLTSLLIFVLFLLYVISDYPGAT